MPDLKKVIDDLKDISKYFFEVYRHENEKEESALALDRSYIIDDAIELLKEQEARVMTREEVLATPEGTVVWMEEESESGTYIQPIVSTGNGCLGNFYIGVGTYGIDLEKRRFWTSRPSPERMQDTPWEDERDA